MRILSLALLATALSACGALLGFGEDDIERPVRSEDAGAANDAGISDAPITGEGAADAADTDVDAGPVVKHVFVTRATFVGGFGGRADANKACTDAAAKAGRGGTWTAYLADLDGVHPSTRIADREWFLYDGRRVFASAPKADAGPSAGIAIDEKGLDFGGTPDKLVWTGLANLTAPNERTCVGWASSDAGAFGGFGDMFATDSTWQQSFATASCNERYRLYCFEE